MTTRERYACVVAGRITAGLQMLDGEDAEALRAEMRTLAEGAQSRGELTEWLFEKAVRAKWPGRAYWIEIGNTESWVQVVEYNAFANKPHKHGAE